MKRKIICGFLVLSLCFQVTFTGGCNRASKVNGSTFPDAAKGPIERSYWPTKEWQVSSPGERGMDTVLLEDLNEKLKGDSIYSMLIAKEGHVVSEYYEAHYNKNTKFRLNACTKSVTSALMGIALEKGYIKDINTSIVEYYNDIIVNDTDERKKKITLKSLLSGTSGIDWPEWSKWNSGFAFMLQSSDWIEFILDRPMEEEPGKRFNYSTGAAHLLSDILTKATGKSTLNFARENLFRPMGITDIKWLKEPDGAYTGGHGLELTTRDAAKFGYLYLNEGVWEGRRLISHSWIEESTKMQSEGHDRYGSYGYQWWIRNFKVEEKEYKAYFAMGIGGQYIFVVPEADIVAVFTGLLTHEEALKPMKYMESHILKAITK